MIEINLEERQKRVCSRVGAQFLTCDLTLKIGISRNFREVLRPINGLRIVPEGDTTGWYIWAGTKWSDDPGFFVPLHASHLSKWAPVVLPYLGLGPGWRFLIDDNYEDVWADPQLLVGKGDR